MDPTFISEGLLQHRFASGRSMDTPIMGYEPLNYCWLVLDWKRFLSCWANEKNTKRNLFMKTSPCDPNFIIIYKPYPEWTSKLCSVLPKRGSFYSLFMSPAISATPIFTPCVCDSLVQNIQNRKTMACSWITKRMMHVWWNMEFKKGVSFLNLLSQIRSLPSSTASRKRS